MKLINQLDYEAVEYPTTMEAGAALCPPYPSVAKAGCGLCCICMLVEQLTGDAVPLEECIRLSVEVGANENGTNMVRLGTAVAERYGLQMTTSNDLDDFRNTLSQQGNVIVNVGRSPGLLSDQGHYVLAIGCRNGLVYIADPSYTKEKYEKEYRKHVVKLEDGFVLLTPEVLAGEAANRDPAFYCFRKTAGGCND